MNNVLVFHGAGETPQSFWHPYLKKTLESNNYKVSIPQLPDANDPNLDKWLSFILKNEKINENTTLVSHSAGCPLVLSVLEKLNIRVKKAVLVAGYCTPLPVKGAANLILQDKYNWEKIRKNAGKFIFINSDNDPWGCDDKQGRKMFDKLGGMLIINHEGHMGSDWMKQPYKEFPLLVKLIEL